MAAILGQAPTGLLEGADTILEGKAQSAAVSNKDEFVEVAEEVAVAAPEAVETPVVEAPVVEAPAVEETPAAVVVDAPAKDASAE